MASFSLLPRPFLNHSPPPLTVGMFVAVIPRGCRFGSSSNLGTPACSGNCDYGLYVHYTVAPCSAPPPPAPVLSAEGPCTNPCVCVCALCGLASPRGQLEPGKQHLLRLVLTGVPVQRNCLGGTLPVPNKQSLSRGRS
jgi:hypothetical protein